MAWSWYIPSKWNGVLPLSLLELLTSAVSIYMTIQQLGYGSHVPAFTNSSSALGWMHKLSFDPVNKEGHDTVAQWLGWTLVSNNSYLYSQHIKGTKNTIADSLSRDFNISYQSLTKKSNPFYHLRQRHHSTSNCHPEILSPGYFH